MSKNIVIVGASRGIGKELVKLFAQNPEHQVIALARSSKAMQEFSRFTNVKPIEFDLDHADVRKQAEEIFSPLEQVDILVNNAGKLVNKPFLEQSTQDLISSYQVNIIGVMQTVQAVVPKMIETGGHIVNISSMGGFQGSVKFAGLSSYSTSKAALVSFTELFSEEYKDSKIAMNCLCLGAVQTEMLAEAFPGYQAPLSAEEMADFIQDFALNSHKFFKGKILPVSLSTP